MAAPVVQKSVSTNFGYRKEYPSLGRLLQFFRWYFSSCFCMKVYVMGAQLLFSANMSLPRAKHCQALLPKSCHLKLGSQIQMSREPLLLCQASHPHTDQEFLCTISTCVLRAATFAARYRKPKPFRKSKYQKILLNLLHCLFPSEFFAHKHPHSCVTL